MLSERQFLIKTALNCRNRWYHIDDQGQARDKREENSVTKRVSAAAINAAEPGLIRVEADELTYDFHIMLRGEQTSSLSNFLYKTDQFTKTGSGQTYTHGENAPKKTDSLTVELEAQLMTGDLKVADVPAAWNAAVKETLGVDVPDDARGYVKTNDKREPLSVLVLFSGCVSSVFVCPEPVLTKQTIVCHLIETIDHYRCAHSLTH
jgi:hypothetical protein